VPFLSAIKKEYAPTRIIGSGDELDSHNMSQWLTELEMDDARTELYRGRKVMRKVAKLFPVMENVDSNHTSRLYRAGKKARILRELLVPYKTLLDVDEYNWTWQHDITINIPGKSPITIVHHAGANVFLNSQRAGRSVIAGHMHTKQKIEYWCASGGKAFAAQTGCLLDKDSPAYTYAVDNIMQPLLGCIIIIEGTPKILEMNCTESGSWDKKLN